MWLTKEKGYGTRNDYELWAHRPNIASGTIGTMWKNGVRLMEWTAPQFAKISPTRLKPGEIREVESITFEFAGAGSPNHRV